MFSIEIDISSDISPREKTRNWLREPVDASSLNAHSTRPTEGNFSNIVNPKRRPIREDEIPLTATPSPADLQKSGQRQRNPIWPRAHENLPEISSKTFFYQ